MSARDETDDIAAGVGNQFGGVVYEGKERNLIELGLRRLTAAGYRIVGPGCLDGETLERAAHVADTLGNGTGINRAISKAIRALATRPRDEGEEG